MLSATQVARTVPFPAFAVLMLLGTTPSRADTDLPRYWPKVGQELSYRTTSEFSTSEGQAMASESTWQVWVVRQNSDGTWRLIFRHAAMVQENTGAARPVAKPAGTKTPPGKPPAKKAAPAKPAPNKANPAKPPQTPAAQANMLVEQVTFAYCDLSADGTIAANPTLGFQFEPRQLLPKLPSNKKDLEKGWTDFDKATQTGYRYRVGEDSNDEEGGPELKIVATRQNPVDEIYLCRSQSTFVFNRDLGIVERIESKLEQGYGLVGTQVSTTELTGVEQFDAAWCKRLDEEMGHYFGVQRRYQELLKAAERNSADAETLLIDAGALLQKAAADIKLPVVKEDLRKQVAKHAGMIGWVARSARDRSDLIDQPAPTWQTKDLEGNAQALRDFKKKVVVLHFWKRGDGWSLRTLPQVERLAEQFADKPVVVLGMNTDSNEQDARFVADKMGLAYPILRADKFAEKYSAGSSMLVVIDQKGMVRDVYAGYSPTLVEDVSKVVTDLLAEDLDRP